jgi:exopolysaccharide production protein ExoQ
MATSIRRDTLNGPSVGSLFQRQFLWVGLLVLLFASISAASVMYSGEAPWAILVPLVVIGVAAGLWIIGLAVGGSTWAIIAYLALVCFITDGQFRARGAGEITTDWQSALKFGLWTGAGVIGFAHLPRLRTLLSQPGPACWLAYITIAIVSSAYAPTPAYSFGCAFSLLCFFAFAFTLTTKVTESQFLWTLSTTLGVFLVIGWIVYYEVPTLGVTQFSTYVNTVVMRMCGIAGQANNLGTVCATYIGAVYLLWRGGYCRLLHALPLAGLGAATLVASDARTGMISIAVGIVGAELARWTWALVASALVVVLGGILYFILGLNVGMIGTAFSRSGDPNEVLTLTGRFDIWAYVWQEILEHPLFGWGYNASKPLLSQYLGFKDDLVVDTAHNMLLQSLFSVGLIGTIPILVVILILFVNLLKRPNRFRDLFLISLVVDGISDTSALGTTPTVLTLLFLIISILPTAPARNPGPVMVAQKPTIITMQHRPSFAPPRGVSA